jgi:hypothetical protein
MFCKQQVAQLRGVADRIQHKGAALVVIGNGSVDDARELRAAQRLSFPVYTDPGRSSYRAAGLKRGRFVSGRMALNAARALLGGHLQTIAKGDPKQQGGAFVFAAGGELRFAFVSEEAGHHPDPEELVEALP